jgi:hypothetical protein
MWRLIQEVAGRSNFIINSGQDTIVVERAQFLPLLPLNTHWEEKTGNIRPRYWLK